MLSCTRMCSFSISFRAKDFPHCSQAWLFTPEQARQNVNPQVHVRGPSTRAVTEKRGGRYMARYTGAPPASTGAYRRLLGSGKVPRTRGHGAGGRAGDGSGGKGPRMGEARERHGGGACDCRSREHGDTRSRPGPRGRALPVWMSLCRSKFPMLLKMRPQISHGWMYLWADGSLRRAWPQQGTRTPSLSSLKWRQESG